MKFGFRRAACGALAGVLGLGMLAGCGSSAPAKIDGSQVVLTVNDEEIQLGLLSFMVRSQQAYMYSMYNQYFGMTDIFDTVYDESSNETYGESVKKDAMKMMQNMVVVRQHAEEYGVSLTDEENAAIDEAASAIISDNSEEVIEKIGITKEQMVELLELQTIESKMLDPMTADVDTEVSDEEAQQTSITYLTLTKATEDTTSEVAGAESGAESAAETVTITAEEQNATKLANAGIILDVIMAESDVASADIKTIAAGIDSSASVTTGMFTTHNYADSYLDQAVIKAALELDDGEVYGEVIETDTAYYIVRLDAMFDEDKTATEKESIVQTRKQDYFDSKIEEWKDASEIEINETVWATLTVTDSEPYQVATPESETESTESTVE